MFIPPHILFVVAALARYEYATEMWRDRDFILGGKVVFSASFIDPEVRFVYILRLQYLLHVALNFFSRVFWRHGRSRRCCARACARSASRGRSS
jgi:hypothetical protein